MMSKLIKAKFRVKIKSLAEEARIIRLEEKRSNDDHDRESLRNHRRGVVRSEQRHTLLAYAFLKNVPYKVVELNSINKPNILTIARIAKSLGPWAHNHEYENSVKAWLLG